MNDLNPPLKVGQVLKPRRTSNYPKGTIVDFKVTADGMIWYVHHEDDSMTQFTLSDIFREFVFNDE
jgi:hypothetical protein